MDATSRSKARRPAYAGIAGAEWAGIALLILGLGWALKVSWRRWPDPVIDFGRELYFPWRISEGGVLYRDFDHLYGPLSHYFNALIFRVFGVGLMKLFAVNVVVYCACLVAAYRLTRAAWGRAAAFAGCLAFVLVFSFSQYVGVGNYNFATPYAHETTHGFLLVLLLVGIWAAWLRDMRPHQALAAGICSGGSVLLKVEIMFAAAALAICAIVRVLVDEPRTRPAGSFGRHALLFLAGALSPVAVAAVGLWSTGAFGLGRALLWANESWLSLFKFWHITAEPAQEGFLGTANLAANARAMLLLAPLTVAAVYAAGLVCRHIERGTVAVGTSVVLAIGAVLIALILPWEDFGTVFPAWICVAAAAEFRVRSTLSDGEAESANTRWLLIAAALALLARMALNPHVYHYGYYQAALAGVVTVAAAFRSMPDLLRLHGKGRVSYVVALGAHLACGMWQLQAQSLSAFEKKTVAIGAGVDRFYGYAADVDPITLLVEAARERIVASPECGSLVVLPEGIMLNYLTRKPSTVPEFMFAPSLIRGALGVRLQQRLRRDPPDCVVLISRDLSEFGVSRFGESVEHGRNIIAWLDANYRVTWRLGGDPLDVTQRGVVLYGRR
jgi:hypothetical protein